MDQATRDFALAALDATWPRGLIVDVGARDVNGVLRAYVPHGARYVGIDVLDGPNVDVVASGDALPFVHPRVIVCCSVLEHTDRAERICREAYRMLGPGGRFVVTTVDDRWPSHSAIDGGALRAGEYYMPVSREQLAHWLSDFRVNDIRTTERGDVLAVAEK